MRFLFLLVFSLLTSFSAWAQSTCGDVFAEDSAVGSVVQEITALAGKRLVTAENADIYAKDLERLGFELFNRNQAPIILEHRRYLMHESRGRLEFLDKALNFENLEQSLKSGEVTFTVKSERFLKTSSLHIFKGRFIRGDETLISFEFRSNGQVAFIHGSHQFRTDKILDYEAVALNGGSILSASVARMVFDSLGDSIVLSRGMNSAEREIWINGESHKLGSRSYFHRIHFALNHYYFNRMPYSAKVPKVVLEKLFTEKKLEINSYNTLEDLSVGMSPIARTPFGLEVEFVITKEAAQELIPYLSPAFRQGVLDLGR